MTSCLPWTRFRRCLPSPAIRSWCSLRISLRSLACARCTSCWPASCTSFAISKTSLVFVLAYVGVKMMVSHHYPIPNLVSLAIIAGILVVGVLASLIAAGRDSAGRAGSGGPGRSATARAPAGSTRRTGGKSGRLPPIPPSRWVMCRKPDRDGGVVCRWQGPRRDDPWLDEIARTGLAIWRASRYRNALRYPRPVGGW